MKRGRSRLRPSRRSTERGAAEMDVKAGFDPPDNSDGQFHQQQQRRPRGFAAASAVGSAGKGKKEREREREREKERTKLRERHRRAITSRMLAGLRQHGNFTLPVRSDMNDVLAALAREAGWIVEADGTTYRPSPTVAFSARNVDNPLPAATLRTHVKTSVDSAPSALRIEDSLSPASLDSAAVTERDLKNENIHILVLLTHLDALMLISISRNFVMDHKRIMLLRLHMFQFMLCFLLV